MSAAQRTTGVNVQVCDQLGSGSRLGGASDLWGCCYGPWLFMVQAARPATDVLCAVIDHHTQAYWKSSWTDLTPHTWCNSSQVQKPVSWKSCIGFQSVPSSGVAYSCDRSHQVSASSRSAASEGHDLNVPVPYWWSWDPRDDRHKQLWKQPETPRGQLTQR
jgi:hypothetical protein